MKMIVVIVQDSDAEPISQALVNNDFRVTRIASTGGFLRHGVVTLLIGVDDNRVEDSIQVIRDHLGETEKKKNRASLFVVPVQHFEKI